MIDPNRTHPYDPSINLDMLSAELSRYQREHGTFDIHIDLAGLMQVIGLLQLGLRHPKLPPVSFVTCMQFIDSIIESLDAAGYETLAHTIQLDQPGNQPRRPA